MPNRDVSLLSAGATPAPPRSRRQPPTVPEGLVLDRDRADRREFRNFLGTVWRHIGLPPPTPVQLDIARYLHRGPKRRVVLAFRGVGKSWIYAAYLAWRLWRRPDAKMLVVSATQAAAESLALFSRRLIREMSTLESLRPGPGQRDGGAGFDVGPARPAKDPSVRAIGIGGQITGARADEVLADDVETLNNSATAAARARLAEQVREFDAVLRPGGRITFLGTPQGADTLYDALPARGFRRRIWPAEIPADPDVYDGALAPSVLDAIGRGAGPGAPLDPARFGADELEIRRLSYGPTGYARQFLLDARPVDPDHYPLSLSDLLVTPLDPDLGPASLEPDRASAAALDGLPMRGLPGSAFHGAVTGAGAGVPYADSLLAVDPSGRGKDETAYVVLNALDGRLFLLDAGGCAGGYDDRTLDRLVAAAARFRVRRVLIESNFGDGMFGRLLGAALARAGLGPTVSDRPAAGAKEARILAALEPVLAQRRLVVDPGVIRRDAAETEAAPYRSLFYQIARLRPERGALAADDRIDALALGVAALAPALSVDGAAAAARRARETERRSARALETALSGVGRSRRWGLARGGRPGSVGRL